MNEKQKYFVKGMLGAIVSMIGIRIAQIAGTSYIDGILNTVMAFAFLLLIFCVYGYFTNDKGF